MLRRSFVGNAVLAAASPLARPAFGQSKARTLTFVPSAPLTALDPIWTTAAVTRVHGYLVFDSLFGMDSDFKARPQMASGARADDDGLTWTVALRDGLTFHDGQRVRARDCVASLKRWMKRSPMGQKLESVMNEITALDDAALRFGLKRPFPQLLDALAAVGPQALIMPERLATTSPFEQVKEIVGSGPYSFKADEFISGTRAVYQRFEAYRPTPDNGKGLTAGPKIANFDRVIWNMIPDPATAASALIAGEVDWYEQLAPDLGDLLRRNKNLVVEKLDRFPQVAGLRFNQLTTPFDSRRVRQAILPALSQEDVALSIAGDNPGFWMDNVGVFTPGTPSASTVGLEPLQGPRNFARRSE